MGAYQLYCICLVVLGFYGTVRSFPFDMIRWARRPLGEFSSNRECESGKSVDVGDPCQPYCVCIDGKVTCAQIVCNEPDTTEDAESVSECWKLQNPQRCCPDYVCRFSNGTASLIYPTPTVNTPDNLYSAVDV